MPLPHNRRPVTISGGIIRVSAFDKAVVVTAESAGADTLDQIDGGIDGQELQIFVAASQTITVAESAGTGDNIEVPSHVTGAGAATAAGVSFVMNSTDDYAVAQRRGANWTVTPHLT